MKKEKWYIQTWFIALWFAFSYFIVPFIVGIVLLILQMNHKKKLKKQWKENGFDEVQNIQQEKEKLVEEIEKMTKTEEKLKKEMSTLEKERDEKKAELIVLEDEILLQSFGFYTPKYDLENSEAYKAKLTDIRNKQKEMVKEQRATNHSNEWQLDGSKQKGRVMNNNNIKITLNAFNNECDTAISKVKFNNIHSMEERIKKAHRNLNKVNKQNKIEIKPEYLALKLDELYLAYEYAQKVQEEKEEQRMIREQMREEAKAQKEIEAAKAKIEKEEKHFQQEIENLKVRMEQGNDSENEALMNKIKELEEKLKLVEKDKEDVYNRQQNTRAGYVYIISNVGSFGENVYKIGMTKRLEPMDRVKELGDASVPFLFDVHALIFSQDAPKLENELHKAFQEKRVNKVNERKEFFAVTLQEIQEEVIKNHSEVVEFTKVAEAKEYRESLMKVPAMN